MTQFDVTNKTEIKNTKPGDQNKTNFKAPASVLFFNETWKRIDTF